jgi:hypothetical protein
MTGAPIVVARQALYEQVWAKPMLQVAAEYRITDTGLAKRCRMACVPVPPPGYWAKVQNGKPVMKRPPLRPLKPGQSETICIQPSSFIVDKDIGDAGLAARVVAECDPSSRITVAAELRDLHPSVKAASARLAKARVDEDGFLVVSDEKAQPESPKVHVTPAARTRALLLLDALFKALDARGCSPSGSGVVIDSQRVSIGIEEKTEQHPHIITPKEEARLKRNYWERAPKWDHVPNGSLSIYTTEYAWWQRDLAKRWSDRRSSRLEGKLNKVVIGLFAIAAAMKQRADEQRREAEARAEQERQRRERERRQRVEAALRKHLLSTCGDWHAAQDIRRLVEEVRRRAQTSEAPDSEAALRWIEWASHVADDLDPLAGGIERLLQRDAGVAEEAGREPSVSPYRW